MNQNRLDSQYTLNDNQLHKGSLNLDLTLLLSVADEPTDNNTLTPSLTEELVTL